MACMVFLAEYENYQYVRKIEKENQRISCEYYVCPFNVKDECYFLFVKQMPCKNCHFFVMTHTDTTVISLRLRVAGFTSSL